MVLGALCRFTFVRFAKTHRHWRDLDPLREFSELGFHSGTVCALDLSIRISRSLRVFVMTAPGTKTLSRRSVMTPANLLRLNLPRLDRLNDQLAAENSRVAALVALLPAQVDALLVAARASNWSQLGQIGRRLARWSATVGWHDVYQRAQALAVAVDQPSDPLTVHRAVIRLASSCGRVKSYTGKEMNRETNLASPGDSQTMETCRGR